MIDVLEMLIHAVVAKRRDLSCGSQHVILKALPKGGGIVSQASRHPHGGGAASAIRRFVDPFFRWVVDQPWIMTRLYLLPSLPTDRLRRGHMPKLGAWPLSPVRVPARLLTVPGIRRDESQERAAFEAAPLVEIKQQYPQQSGAKHRGNWDAYIPVWGAVTRAEIKAQATFGVRPVTPRSSCDPISLTKGLKQRAAELGLSAIGIAEYDPRYTFKKYQGECVDAGDRVVVCLVEVNFEAFLTAPSARAERSLQAASAAVIDRCAELAGYLHGLGFRATAWRPDRFLAIPYAVQAGLGQLGRNGQLLSPVAGSRLRITSMQTNAPLLCDQPMDYGITALCDSCMVCVNRCPPSAIPNRRKMWRGVEKSKINLARCLPVIIKAHGCAVCTRVCPVQRFGLQPVLDEFGRSGRVLGKDTDDLEGYDIDGMHYGPGERPKFDKAIFSGLGLDDALAAGPDAGESRWSPGSPDM